MNLVWLKYVSYACVAGAAFFYYAIRLNRLAISRNVMLTLYAVCIVVACGAWHWQESNTDQHSPRRLVVGTVTSVSASAHRSGSIEDDFQLRIDDGSLSPKFSTDVVAGSRSEQPIHMGDTLGVLYRTWDGVPLTIDELQGQRPGWHYRRYRVLDPYVWAIGIPGFLAFIGAFVSSRRRRAQSGIPETALEPSGS
ncbi:MAG: hypothetical protein ABSG84_06400 [Acidobacteriaceae bacterium]